MSLVSRLVYDTRSKRQAYAKRRRKKRTARSRVGLSCWLMRMREESLSLGECTTESVLKSHVCECVSALDRPNRTRISAEMPATSWRKRRTYIATLSSGRRRRFRVRMRRAPTTTRSPSKNSKKSCARASSRRDARAGQESTLHTHFREPRARAYFCARQKTRRRVPLSQLSGRVKSDYIARLEEHDVLLIEERAAAAEAAALEEEGAEDAQDEPDDAPPDDATVDATEQDASADAE